MNIGEDRGRGPMAAGFDLSGPPGIPALVLLGVSPRIAAVSIRRWLSALRARLSS